MYEADTGCGLREVAPTLETVFDFNWLLGSPVETHADLDQAFSRLAGLPLLDCLARERVDSTGPAEHWPLRLPVPGVDGWIFPLAEERLLPPPGAVTYLVRFHHNVPVLRLDLDRVYWEQRIQGQDEEETRNRERRLFEDLDYASHDRRCYGYPYPIKAGHDRASLTQPERVALRKMIIDAAVRTGLKRSLFRDAAQATGYG